MVCIGVCIYIKAKVGWDEGDGGRGAAIIMHTDTR